MALNLRKTIIRTTAVNTAICFVLSMGLGLLSGAVEFDSANMAWPVVMALGIGLFSGWRTTVRIKNGLMRSVLKPISYTHIGRDTLGDEGKFDWKTIDDYAVQLETRGYSLLGEYSNFPRPKHFIAVAAIFANASKSVIVEVQDIQVTAQSRALRPGLNGVHFSFVSVVGGNIRLTTTDHGVAASNYLIRGDNNVFASHPGMGLMALLEKHEQTLASVCERTGKSASTGLTAVRHVLVIRENLLQARHRLEKMNGYEIAKQVDAFEADPMTSWAPPTEMLAALPERRLEDLDTSPVAQGTPPIIELSAPAEAAPSMPCAADNADRSAPDDVPTKPAAEEDAQATMLREQAISGANWFYWIAGLSLVNAVIAALGSNWGFAIGLGISQLLSGMAHELRGVETSSGSVALLYAASFAVTGFFAVCGWLSRRPSIVAFVVGIAVFALDSLIFLAASDWIGVAFHALALFYIWNGFSAARRLKKYAGAA